jgi:hypothetical protein
MINCAYNETLCLTPNRKYTLLVVPNSTWLKNSHISLLNYYILPINDRNDPSLDLNPIELIKRGYVSAPNVHFIQVQKSSKMVKLYLYLTLATVKRKSLSSNFFEKRPEHPKLLFYPIYLFCFLFIKTLHTKRPISLYFNLTELVGIVLRKIVKYSVYYTIKSKIHCLQKYTVLFLS